MMDEQTKTAVLFTPQVYVKPGEYRGLYDKSSVVRNKLAIAADVLGYDLVAAFFADHPNEVNHGPVARPAILALSSALYEIACNHLSPPSYMAGPSLGQITAAHIGGFLSFPDAIRMVYEMASLEYEVFNGKNYGAYFFHNVDTEELSLSLEGVKSAGYYLHPSIYMAENQMIVTGDLSGLKLLSSQALRLGGIGVAIPYGVPSHCSLMEGVKKRFSEQWRYKDEPKDPIVPLICNLTTEVLRTKEQVHSTLLQQYTSTVRWTQSIERMAQLGVNKLTILGPGCFVRKSLNFMSTSFDTECYGGTGDLAGAGAPGLGLR